MLEANNDNMLRDEKNRHVCAYIDKVNPKIHENTKDAKNMKR
jgi:hypothetical protein